MHNGVLYTVRRKRVNVVDFKLGYDFVSIIAEYLIKQYIQNKI